MIKREKSGLIDLLRGYSKPFSATMEDWDTWTSVTKQQHPYRYWLFEKCIPDTIDILRWPIDFILKIKYYILNRYVTKTHCLTSNLQKGQWYEFEDRMLHCLFDELVNFVEIEKAWLEVVFGEHKEDYGANIYSSGVLRTRRWRSEEAGIAYIKWEQGLTNEDGTPTEQAKNAIELERLYNWWKYIRPHRQYDDNFMLMSELRQSLENKYDDEDTEMLIKLIKLRSTLWT